MNPVLCVCSKRFTLHPVLISTASQLLDDLNVRCSRTKQSNVNVCQLKRIYKDDYHVTRNLPLGPLVATTLVGCMVTRKTNDNAVDKRNPSGFTLAIVSGRLQKNVNGPGSQLHNLFLFYHNAISKTHPYSVNLSNGTLVQSYGNVNWVLHKFNSSPRPSLSMLTRHVTVVGNWKFSCCLTFSVSSSPFISKRICRKCICSM